MRAGFRKFRSIRLSESLQGELFFMLKNYKYKSCRVQMEIVNLCEEIGGENAVALFELLTTDSSAVQINMRYYIPERALYDMRRDFYHKWFERGMNRME